MHWASSPPSGSATRPKWTCAMSRVVFSLWHSATHCVSRARKGGEEKERKSSSLSPGLRISFLFYAARPFCHIQRQPLCQRGKKRRCPYFLTANAGSLPPPSYTDLRPATSAIMALISSPITEIWEWLLLLSSQERGPLCWPAQGSTTWWAAEADLPMQSNTLT